MLFSPRRFRKYLSCIAIGVPIYFTTGILLTFAPELTAGLHVRGQITAGNALLFGSIGLTIGDLLSGLLSQFLGSRKNAIISCLLVGFATMLIYTLGNAFTNTAIYVLCFIIGVTVGYWAVLVTMAAEQFGTNLRGTVATTVPNFVRGSAIFVTLGFIQLKRIMPVPRAALAVGTVCFLLAIAAAYFLEDTFHRDLDYFEK
jgi:putative MFS transporter